MKIQLVDYNEEMCRAWHKYFDDCNDVFIYEDNFFSVPTDCYVSPANSFGFLDGGIDNKIRKMYENRKIDIQSTVQDYIIKEFDGELLVGQAIYFPIWDMNSPKVPDLIVAPTMRVPMSLENDSVNVYLAARAIFLKIKTLKALNTSRIKSVSISGLGTGIGQFPYDLCAKQMRKAYDDYWIGKSYFPASWGEAQDRHQLLYSDKIEGDLQYKKNQKK